MPENNWNTGTSADYRRPVLTLAVLLLCLLLGFVLTQHRHPRKVVDEKGHVSVIREIAKGNLDPGLLEKHRLPMLPGYHLTMALVARSAGDSLLALRSVSFALALLLLPLAGLVTRSFTENDWLPRTLQIALIPIWPVTSWLVYTDGASLVLVVAGFLLWRRKRFRASALTLTAATLVRQNNAVWALVLVAADLLENAGGDVRQLPAAIRSRWRALWPLLAPVLVPITLLLTTGRLVFGSSANNPPALHPTQIYAQAAFFFILFAPAIVRDLPRQALAWKSRLRSRQYGFLLAAILLGVFFVVTTTPEALHRNNLKLEIQGMLDVDDLVPVGLSLTPLTRVAGFALLWIVGSFLAHVAASSRNRWLLGAILLGAVVYFLPSWLIAVRYALIPTTLLLTVADEPRLTDRPSVVWAGALSVILSTGFLTGTTFW